MRRFVLIILISLSGMSYNAGAQLVRITPEELNFREVLVDSVAELEFTIENLAEEEYLIADVFPGDAENLSLNWTGRRVEALKVMDILRQIYSAVIHYFLDFGRDASSIQELENAGYLELPEYIRSIWTFSLIGRNSVSVIEAISLDEMPYGRDWAVIFGVATNAFDGFGTPVDDPQEPLRVMETMNNLNTAIINYSLDFEEEPESIEILLDNEYLFIPSGILNNWDFALVGENQADGINAVSTVHMADGAGLTIHYDIALGQCSGHRIPYQEFHDWLWSLGDRFWGVQENLTLSVSFRPDEPGEFSSEIMIVITQPGIAGADTLVLPVSGNGVLTVPDFSEDFPSKFSLLSTYPNPFNSTTTITYSLPQAYTVTLKMYDLSGRLVSQLINGRQEAGVHAAIVKADDWASGLYFVRLEAGREVFTRKVMLVR